MSSNNVSCDNSRNNQNKPTVKSLFVAGQIHSLVKEMRKLKWPAIDKCETDAAVLYQSGKKQQYRS